MNSPAQLWPVSVFALSLGVAVNCAAGTFSTNASADAFVATGTTGNLANDNFGAAGSLTIESGALPQGEFQTVLQFNLSGAESQFNAEYGAGDWTIQSVTLQLSASPHGNAIFNPVAPGEFGVSSMANNSWEEGTGTGGSPTMDGISYNTLQTIYTSSANDQSLGSFRFIGGTSGTGNYALTLTSDLTGDLQAGNDLSLRLSPEDNTVSYLFNSRTAAPSPELVIVAVPEPGTLQLSAAGLAVFSLWNRLRRVPS